MFFFGRYLSLICMVGLLSSPIAFAQEEEQEALVQTTQDLFMRAAREMRSTRHIPFQNWIRTQEAFWLLQGLIDNPETSVALRQKARRAQGIGYYIIGLYDIAVEAQRTLAEEVVDDLRYTVLTDLAQTYETMGRYRDAAIVSERIIALSQPPSDADLNNLARQQLKAGRYSACIKTVDRIRLNETTAATRLLSARAYAYHGSFEEALKELRKADNNGNREAINMAKVLGHLQIPTGFWREDKQKRRMSWLPVNQIPMNHAVDSSELNKSIVATVHWYGANYPIYPDVDHSAYPPNMPEDLRPGLYGFASMGAVPFLVFQVKEMNEATQSRLRAIIKEVRPQPVGINAMQALKLDHKILYRVVDNGYIAVLVHQPWQSLVVKLAYPKLVWETM